MSWKDEVRKNRYSVGRVVLAPVERVVEFGTFVRLPSDVPGLIHYSRLIGHPRPGDVVKVKIIEVDALRERINLTMLPDARESVSAEYELVRSE